MAEYIEKQDIYDAIDLLMTRFPYKVPGRPDTYHLYNEAWADACSYALDIIRHHHPADVRPVVRSHWKKNDNGTYSCERCHSWIKGEQRHYANWCLYCGADMMGGDAE